MVLLAPAMIPPLMSDTMHHSLTLLHLALDNTMHPSEAPEEMGRASEEARVAIAESEASEEAKEAVVSVETILGEIMAVVKTYQDTMAAMMSLAAQSSEVCPEAVLVCLSEAACVVDSVVLTAEATLGTMTAEVEAIATMRRPLRLARKEATEVAWVAVKSCEVVLVVASAVSAAASRAMREMRLAAVTTLFHPSKEPEVDTTTEATTQRADTEADTEAETLRAAEAAIGASAAVIPKVAIEAATTTVAETQKAASVVAIVGSAGVTQREATAEAATVETLKAAATTETLRASREATIATTREAEATTSEVAKAKEAKEADTTEKRAASEAATEEATLRAATVEATAAASEEVTPRVASVAATVAASAGATQRAVIAAEVGTVAALRTTTNPALTPL